MFLKQIEKKTSVRFKKEGFSRSTVKRYIKIYGESDNINFKAPPGRQPDIATYKMLKNVENFYVKHPAITVPTSSKKLKIDKKYLQHI